LDVWPLLQEAVVAKKEVVLPRFDPDSDAYVVCRLTDLNDTLPPGKFGILEPHHDSPPYPLNQLDLVLVPGVAFDIGGRRLGRGKGFYDRLLASVSGTKCGVAFDEQVESALPWEPHDVTMDCLVTPSRWLDLRRSGNA
jgi:5-formyltetrahydrofolate cyclo-ligase